MSIARSTVLPSSSRQTSSAHLRCSTLQRPIVRNWARAVGRPFGSCRSRRMKCSGAWGKKDALPKPPPFLPARPTPHPRPPAILWQEPGTGRMACRRSSQIALTTTVLISTPRSSFQQYFAVRFRASLFQSTAEASTAAIGFSLTTTSTAFSEYWTGGNQGSATFSAAGPTYRTSSSSTFSAICWIRAGRGTEGLTEI